MLIFFVEEIGDLNNINNYNFLKILIKKDLKRYLVI